MQKWEYAILPIHLLETEIGESPSLVDPMEHVKKLNEHGGQGWELVTVIPLTSLRAGVAVGDSATFSAIGFLKRPISD